MTFERRFIRDLVHEEHRTDGSDVEKIVRGLKECYSAPDRHYHRGAHIIDCLETFNAVHVGMAASREIRAAIYFHDAILDPRRDDNEEKSADYAKHQLLLLGYLPSFCERVADIILGTKHTGGLVDRDQQIMADVDLSSLAASWSTFSENTHDIREEYHWVSDDDFRKGRADFLKNMLKREYLYYTRSCRHLFELRARDNMTRSIQELLA